MGGSVSLINGHIDPNLSNDESVEESVPEKSDENEK